MDNFHEKAKITYDNLDNISKSENNNHFIENNEIFMYNFDNICFNANLRENGKPKRNLPASTDAIYFNEEKSTLYFLEFKNLPLKSTDYKKELETIINLLKSNYNIDEYIINSLDNIYKRFEDEIICKLKNKTNESLFFSLPLIYETYCEKLGMDYNQSQNDFILWLLNLNKKFIFVFAENNEISPSNRHFSFEVRLKDKIKYFDNLPNIQTTITTKNNFENNFIHKHFDNS